jgi:hypothetical protein
MFYAFIMKVGGDIDWIQGYKTEEEVDAFAKEESAYGELTEDDDPEHWEKYDPPIIIVVECDQSNQMESGKYKRVVSVFQRGEKFVCVKGS